MNQEIELSKKIKNIADKLNEAYEELGEVYTIISKIEESIKNKN